MLLSRAAENLYWAARYLERAEDTARLVRVFTEVIIDLPVTSMSSWRPLAAVAGPVADGDDGPVSEQDVVTALLSDPRAAASVVACIAHARENLRTTREIIPREAWLKVNDLFLFCRSDPAAGVDRARRGRFCDRVVADVQLLDGILTSTMSRDAAYQMWRLGESIERADMTTRILGVRAAALLVRERTGGDEAAEADHGVQWMGVLRSLSGMQMFQRAASAPIDGRSVVTFLLGSAAFPRSVAYGIGRIAEACANLPHAATTRPAVERLQAAAEEALRMVSNDVDGGALDAAMDLLQGSLIAFDRVITETFFLHRGGQG